jgi:hypothetical protein
MQHGRTLGSGNTALVVALAASVPAPDTFEEITFLRGTRRKQENRRISLGEIKHSVIVNFSSLGQRGGDGGINDRSGIPSGALVDACGLERSTRDIDNAAIMPSTFVELLANRVLSIVSAFKRSMPENILLAIS